MLCKIGDLRTKYEDNERYLSSMLRECSLKERTPRFGEDLSEKNSAPLKFRRPPNPRKISAPLWRNQESSHRFVQSVSIFFGTASRGHQTDDFDCDCSVYYFLLYLYFLSICGLIGLSRLWVDRKRTQGCLGGPKSGPG